MIYRLNPEMVDEFLDHMSSNKRVYGVIGLNPFEATFDDEGETIVEIRINGKTYKPEDFTHTWSCILGAAEIRFFERITLEDIVSACADLGVDFNCMVSKMVPGRHTAQERLQQLKQEMEQLRKKYNI